MRWRMTSLHNMQTEYKWEVHYFSVEEELAALLAGSLSSPEEVNGRMVMEADKVA